MLVMPPREKARREREEHEKRQNQIMQGLLNNYDTEIVVSDNATVEDCIEAPLKEFKIRGKDIMQETREGYNLLNTALVRTSHNGVDYILNNDGSIHVIGTASEGGSNSGGILIDFPSIVGDNFTVSCTNMQEGINFITWYDDYENFGGSVTSLYPVKNVTTTKDTTQIRIRFDVEQEYTVDTIIYPMILKGSYTKETIPPYEQFGQSPSIEFESPLEYSKGNQEIYHANESLIDFISNLPTSANYGNIKIKVIDDNIVLNGTPTTNYVAVSRSIDITNILEDGKKYHIYRMNDNKAYAQVNALKYDGKLSYYSPNSTNSYYAFTVDKSTYKKYVIQLQLNTVSVVGTLENYIVKCMLVKSDVVPKTYIEHQSETIKLTNLPPFYSKNDYIYYDEKKKKYFVHNKLIKINGNTLSWQKDGSENNYRYYTDDLKAYITKTSVDIKARIYCNYLEASTANENYLRKNNSIAVDGAGRIYVYSKDLRNMTNEQFNEYILQLEDFYIIYELAEPTDTEITESVLIEQLDKLRKMFTYSGTNHFIVTSENGQACNLEVTAYKDTLKIMKSRIDELETKIDALIVDNA